MISAHDVEQAAFRRAEPGRSGYDEVSVDDFLDRAVATLEAIEKHAKLPADALTSKDVVDAVFPEKDENTDGGYDLDDVDDLLDRVAQRLYDDEKKRGDVGASDGSRDERAGFVEEGGAGRHETFRDEPAAPELQDDTRSWEEEPRGGRDDVRPVQETHGRDEDLAGVNPVGGEAVTERPVAEPDGGQTRAEHPSEAESQVEQYPATDHRVPLPRGDIRSQLSEEDVRAQNNYHPEYSEYEATASQEHLDRGPDAGVLPGQDVPSAAREEKFEPFDEPARTETTAAREDAGHVDAEPTVPAEPTPVPGDGVRVVSVERIEESDATTGEAAATTESRAEEPVSESSVSESSVPEPTAPQGFEGLRPADLSASDSAAETGPSAESTPASEPVHSTEPTTNPVVEEPVPAAAEKRETSDAGTDAKNESATGVGRPEGISRPEPIERPRDLPKRDDNTRKGLLRRIFKG